VRASEPGVSCQWDGGQGGRMWRSKRISMNSALRLEWLTCSSTVLSACAAPPAFPPPPTYALSCCVVVPAAAPAQRVSAVCPWALRRACEFVPCAGTACRRAGSRGGVDRMCSLPPSVARVNPAAREQCGGAGRHGAWARARTTRLRYACARHRAPSPPARDAAAPSSDGTS
jgi:hypothetical protein